MIDLVIPSLNGLELLRSCLAHLDTQEVPHRIYVVDNGSSDGTAEWLVEHRPAVRVIALTENLGFGAAVNRGMAAGDSEMVVLLNNDVDVDPGFLAALVAPLRADSRVGSVAGLLLRPGREEIDSFGIEVDVTLAGYARLSGQRLAASRLDEVGLLGASGGAAAFRRAALTDVGWFDERIFAYSEDVDLALRLRAAGWAARAAPDAVGVHLGGASFGVRSAWQSEVAGASRAYVIRKYGVLRAGAAVAIRTLSFELGVAAVDLLTRRRWSAVRGRVRGWKLGRGIAAIDPLPVDAVNLRLNWRMSLRRRWLAA